MKRKLYPSIRGPMSSAMCRLPDDVIDYVASVADRDLVSRSSVLRSLVLDSLRAQGIVATADDLADARKRETAA